MLTTTEQVLVIYESMAQLSTAMLAAARDGDWDRLTELERDCAAQLRILHAHEATVAMHGPARTRKIALIRNILADDREIRDLTMPWMARLSALIGNTRAQTRLANAYGAV